MGSLYNLVLEFPSPGGDYGLSDEIKTRTEVEDIIGFRPLAGITVFRTSVYEAEDAATIAFPSPGGDYGLSDAVWGVITSMVTGGFRPLAGITVFRTVESLCGKQVRPGSFRPLAGITVFRTRSLEIGNLSGGWKFPSPGGDYGLSDPSIYWLHWIGPSGFRPLAGITVFRTPGLRKLSESAHLCFRPLAGITVFRTEWRGGVNPWTREVSVPWRGLRSFGRDLSRGGSRQKLGFRPLAGITVFRTG